MLFGTKMTLELARKQRQIFILFSAYKLQNKTPQNVARRLKNKAKPK